MKTLFVHVCEVVIHRQFMLIYFENVCGFGDRKIEGGIGEGKERGGEGRNEKGRKGMRERVREKERKNVEQKEEEEEEE